jgi:hypothetical protein
MSPLKLAFKMQAYLFFAARILKVSVYFKHDHEFCSLYESNTLCSSVWASDSICQMFVSA